MKKVIVAINSPLIFPFAEGVRRAVMFSDSSRQYSPVDAVSHARTACDMIDLINSGLNPGLIILGDLPRGGCSTLPLVVSAVAYAEAILRAGYKSDLVLVVDSRSDLQQAFSLLGGYAETGGGLYAILSDPSWEKNTEEVIGFCTQVALGEKPDTVHRSPPVPSVEEQAKMLRARMQALRDLRSTPSVTT